MQVVILMPFTTLCGGCGGMVRIDHNHVTVCFLCNICSQVSEYHLVKRAMIELAVLKGTLHLGATGRIRKIQLLCVCVCVTALRPSS